MINSLSKDSHITRGSSHFRLRPLQESVRQNLGSKTTANNYEIKNQKPVETSFCGFFSAEKFYKSPTLKKVLNFAADQQLVFSATFALLLTCILRPGAILVIPSKKNKDDQRYASGHSIASGVIGFAITTVAFTPISSGIKKFNANLKTYIKDDTHYLYKNKDIPKITKVYLDRLPDLITAIPKGVLTIALIPPIMKYVFGLEKKSASAGKNSTLMPVDYSLLNFKSANTNANGKGQFASFKGGIK